MAKLLLMIVVTAVVVGGVLLVRNRARERQRILRIEEARARREAEWNEMIANHPETKPADPPSN